MVSSRLPILACALLWAASSTTIAAEAVLPVAHGYQTREAWREPVAPFRIADNTWYIGTRGLTALLVKTDEGAVLLDGGVASAADMLLEHMASVGVEPRDLTYILHSHAHGDHAGPLAAVKRATGAMLASNAESAVLLARGGSDDIHYADAILFPPVQADRLLQDGETITLGGMAFTVHFTPAHTPGSMSWSWTDTRDGQPVRIAYADSVSAPDYRLLDNPRYPRIVEDYRAGFAAIRALPCDLLIAPHADSVGWAPGAAADRHPAPVGCQAYADNAERRLDEQLATQRREAGN